MAAEPITIFSHTIDPAGVLDLLRRMVPDLRVDGAGPDWRTITITGPKRLLRKPWTLSFGHDPDYYAGDDWAQQIDGMQGYFARFPQNENTGRIMLLIQSFRFALTLFPVPQPDLHLESDDPRLPYLRAVVKHLDGVMFMPSSLRDAAGRVLYDATGDPDPAAVMPAIFKDVAGPRDERTRSQGGTQPDAEDAPPPSPQRVARRALALAAVCGRALLEQEDASDPGVDQTRQRILDWVNEVGFGDELEPDEWKALQRPLGAIDARDAANATWRLEGLGVLSWALRRYEVPPHDTLVNPGELLPSVGILNADAARELLANPSLRPVEELTRLRERLFALHWRLTDWRIKPQPMDFAKMAREAWFGPLDVSGLPLIDDDLAIGNAPIARADANAVHGAMSAALERHLAANWLCGGSEVYSETDVST